MVLSHKDKSSIELSDRTGNVEELMEYRILETLEFNSDRKRMSIVVHPKGSSTYMLYIKGP